MNKHICVLPGDGIGPEVTAQALRVLDAVGRKFGHTFTRREALIGGAAIDATGNPLPAETLHACREADAVLLGAVGGPQWDNLPDNRPEAGLLGIRKELGLYANFRPAVLYPELAASCPLRPELTANGLDVFIVRELTGDVYFGQPAGREIRHNQRVAFNNMIYFEDEVRRIAHMAFKVALGRKKRLCSVDKANVLEVSRLWREVMLETASEYPEVELSHLYVDNAAMQLVVNPGQFDVIVTGNLFGDILSDEASVITGSIGMLPSASLGEHTALYEPIHGSAPDIAGKDLANPLATILSVAMLLRYSFAQQNEAEAVERAVKQVLADGFRTGDIMGPGGQEKVGCARMGELVVERI